MKVLNVFVYWLNDVMCFGLWIGFRESLFKLLLWRELVYIEIEYLVGLIVDEFNKSFKFMYWLV